MATTRNYTVTTTASAARTVADIAADLARAGFEVDQVLDAIGVVTGHCAPAALATLRRVKGVADIAPDANVGVGPPGSPDTW